MSELEQLRADLARVTAERNEALDRADELETQLLGARGYTAMPAISTTAQMQAEVDTQRGRVLQLQQRIAELEKDWQYAEMGRANWQSNHRLARDKLRASEQRNAELVEQLKAYGKYAHDTTLEDQNAELVAALKCVRDAPGSDQNAPYRLRKIAQDALACVVNR